MQLNLKFEEYTLANGLRVILHQESSTPIVAVNVWYHVGSWDEKPGKTGFAHLFEHMMFQGSENVGSDMHFKLLQSVGGSVNGSTSFNRTNYYETVPSNQLELALWLEADRMGYLLPAMTQEKLDNQRDVVKNERRQTVDNQPYGTWLEKMLETAYPKTFSYHWPIIGYMKDLDTASLEDISQFFKTYYAPANASLCLAGDFDTTQAKEWIEKYFGPIKGERNIPRVTKPFNGAFAGEKRVTVADQVQLPRLFMAYHLPAFGEKEWYAADFLCDLISSGKSGRLYNSLVRKKQLAQDAGAFILNTEGTSLLIFIATATFGTELNKIEKAFEDELKLAVEKGFKTEEIVRTKNQIEAQNVRELQNVAHIADAFNSAVTYFNDPDYVNKELAIYGAINEANLLHIIKTYLIPENRVVLNYIPQNS